MDYRGFSYSQASREASRLLDVAVRSGRWIDLPEKLVVLREIMARQSILAVPDIARVQNIIEVGSCL